MPQTCPNCLWISSDEAEECDRCGESFDGKLKSPITREAVGGVATTLVGLIALGILGAIVFQRYGDRFTGVQQSLVAALNSFYVWLLGPNEIFKPYLVIALVVTLVVWVVLFLLAQFR